MGLETTGLICEINNTHLKMRDVSIILSVELFD
jgi:hypothetical protein